MKTNQMLATVIVLQGLTLVGQRLGPGGYTSTAHAELPNPGERQLAILDEIKGTNARLDRMLTMLGTGEVQVRIAKAEEK